MDPSLLLGTIFAAGYIFTAFYILPAAKHYIEELGLFFGLVLHARKGKHAGAYSLTYDFYRRFSR